MNEMLMLLLRAFGHGQTKRRIAREEPHTEIAFDCPRCLRQLSAEVCDIDMRVICAHCQKKITVPELGIFPQNSKRLPKPGERKFGQVFGKTDVISPNSRSPNGPSKKNKGLDDYTSDAICGTANFFGRVAAKVSKRAAVAAAHAAAAPFQPKEISFQRNGRLVGIFCFKDACNMIRSGEIWLTDLYFHEGMNAYEPVGNSSLGIHLARERSASGD